MRHHGSARKFFGTTIPLEEQTLDILDQVRLVVADMWCMHKSRCRNGTQKQNIPPSEWPENIPCPHNCWQPKAGDKIILLHRELDRAGAYYNASSVENVETGERAILMGPLIRSRTKEV